MCVTIFDSNCVKGFPEMATDQVPSISEWFRGRNIFVTGGTGFMGKILIYKLLMSCPDLGNIFVLIRQKRNRDPQTRLQEMMQEEPFKIIGQKHPERLKKIIIVSGDATIKDLALSPEIKQRIFKEVTVVFNAAANVKFSLTLKDAITINTGGTTNVLNFVKQIQHLEVFVHVSTAYSQSKYRVLEEKSYPTSIEPEIMMQIASNLPEDIVELIKPKVLGELPNTYTYSKSLSELMVHRSGLPAGIARPSIVGPSYKEPLAGWVDNMNGPTGLFVAAAKGVLRTMLCNENCNLNLIPCDMAINAIIAFAWKIGRDKPKETVYMNVCNGNENPILWKDAIKFGREFAINYPFSGIFWYPGGNPTTSKIVFYLRVIILQLLPSYIIDTILSLFGHKPFLMDVQERVKTGMKLLQYYTTKEWEFRQDCMKKVHFEMNPSDREEFFMETSIISWRDYILIYILGARQYCLKDDLSTLPRARKVMRYMYYLDFFVKTVMVLFFLWILYFAISSYQKVTTTAFEVGEI